jgi:arylsulfatase A-like enzyme
MVDEDVIQEQPDLASLTERYAEQAVRFIRSNKDNPFFLYFAHMYVHLPLMVPSVFMKQSNNGAYGAAVECIDWTAGVIIDELRRQGIENNTLVVFTSDNGSRNDSGDSNGPLRGRKGTTWEGGQRLPCLMYWPGKIKAGSVCSKIASSIDFMPTFTLLAGGNVPGDRIIDGKDIRSLMFNEDNAESPHKAFFYYSMNNLEAVRCGKWKLHVRKGKEVINELYDLENDISEQNNLYAQNTEVVGKLNRLIDACRYDIGDDAQNIAGINCRPHGKVLNPAPLTCYNANHPYISAMYDTNEAG